MSGASTSAVDYLVSDLVALALRQIGVGAQGTTPSSLDTADGLMHLNMMLAQWQRKRWLVPNLVDLFATSNGHHEMQIGPGRDFDVLVRPDKIQSAFARYLGNGVVASGDFSATDFDLNDFDNSDLGNTALAIDYPLAIVESAEDYAMVPIKNLRTWPCAAYYSPSFPVGILNVWPIPAVGQFEIHILCKQALPSSLALTDTLNLPPEYWDAVMWNLAARMAPSYGQEAGPTVIAQARATLNTIRTANVQIPSLALPGDLRRGSGRGIPAAYVQAGFV